METQERKLRTNLDTDLLKLVAIAAMLVDHIGGAFFPEIPVFRWIGRLAFPLFCYCLTVGLLYTHDTGATWGGWRSSPWCPSPSGFWPSTPTTSWAT